MSRTGGLFLLLLIAAGAFVIVRDDAALPAGREGATAMTESVDEPAEPVTADWAAAARTAMEPEDAPGAAPEEPGQETGRRVLVSIDQRRLWLVDGQDTLFSAPVAVGMAKDFTYDGRRYHFATPRGTRRVIAKVRDPIWVVPEWHYYEKAEQMGIPEVVKLEMDDRILLSDSSLLVVRAGQVGRVNHFGNFAAFTPGTEIIFDERLYIPPRGSAQRRVPDALGPFKLDTGDGYLIHGTHPYNEDTIGDAVSHGCVRMNNSDITRLYPMVPRGTPVIIF